MTDRLRRLEVTARMAVVGVFFVALIFGIAGCGETEAIQTTHEAAEVPMPEPRPEDVATIDGIIAAYYEVVSGPAGESSDQERDNTLHHPDAWVAIANVDSAGTPFVNVTPLDGYYGDNAPRAEGFWEWETDRVVQRSGNMVHVWSHYATAREERGEPYYQGVNSITLFNDGERWWIMGWMFDGAAG